MLQVKYDLVTEESLVCMNTMTSMNEKVHLVTNVVDRWKHITPRALKGKYLLTVNIEIKSMVRTMVILQYNHSSILAIVCLCKGSTNYAQVIYFFNVNSYFACSANLIILKC
jgi:hypothetical protein